MTLSTNNPVYSTRTIRSKHRRSRFNLRSTNVRILASSSMVLCSTLLINTALEATGSETPAPSCDKGSDAKNNCRSTEVQPINLAPEANSKPQWSELEKLQVNKQPTELPKEVETTYSQLLNRAQSAASRDQLTAAVETVASIPKNSQHYEVAQQLEEDWSKELVRQATNHFQQAEVTTSIALIDKIPESSQWHDRGVELKQQWKKQAQLLNQAKSAKSAEDWQGTINAIKALEGTPLYHSLPVQELLQQAMVNRYEPDPALLKIAIEDAPMLPQSEPVKTIATRAP
ncbi:hypothetical protein [Leptolyngbya sp. NIES-2104]|uniref:hypothetical protein n=1 Tax=Leptolyngbya sp. NIES-2104 TaxID=1552121 RepID=UPI0006ECC80D|nr:hypothetical protein [Leptolyngbya sp. NIES-2104]GAP95534.1 hypothetical protein NIES2104_20560 [Leptolyngbya sp. NIES-2104]